VLLIPENISINTTALGSHNTCCVWNSLSSVFIGSPRHVQCYLKPPNMMQHISQFAFLNTLHNCVKCKTQQVQRIKVNPKVVEMEHLIVSLPLLDLLSLALSMAVRYSLRNRNRGRDRDRDRDRNPVHAWQVPVVEAWQMANFFPRCFSCQSPSTQGQARRSVTLLVHVRRGKLFTSNLRIFTSHHMTASSQITPKPPSMCLYCTGQDKMAYKGPSGASLLRQLAAI
jgi:hypothetical protein